VHFVYLLADGKWDSLPHVILTGDTDWDSGILDLDLDNSETWFNAISDLPLDKPPSVFDEVGIYTKRVVYRAIKSKIVGIPPSAL